MNNSENCKNSILGREIKRKSNGEISNLLGVKNYARQILLGKGKFSLKKLPSNYTSQP